MILERAAGLLAESPTGDVSTRAVCEAAGVSQPVLYRLFGDKDGLLAAVVDHVWAQYLGMKRAQERSDDPLVDLLGGWDSHTAFALEHPHAYRLLFGTSLSARASSAEEAMALLRENLERLAAQGRLAVTPEDAARMVLAANTGVSLALLLRGDQYPDLSISTRLRDTLYRSLLVDAPAPLDGGTFVAATTLRSALATGAQVDLLTSGERGLLDEWLTRLQQPHRSR
ncbi:MAG TPA: TetR/AcrR family transcriptional regulator [Cellulomonas sp.]